MPEQPELEKLKGFQIEEPGGLTDLPDIPDPNSPEFQTGELGTGIKIARAISILLAGASDPNLAAALSEQFQRQDLIAREDAQNRYKIALGRTEAQREEIQFQEGVRETRVKEQIGAANVQLDALNAALRASELEYQITRDKEKRETLPTTIVELQKLRDAIAPETPKPVQVKSPLDLIGQVPPEEISKALSEGRGDELVAQFNQEQLSRTATPKALVSKEAFDALLTSTDPAGQLYVQAMFATVPDPRTDVFGSPADSLTFNSAARRLVETDPEAHDRVVESVTQAWVASGRVPDLETAETIFADSEHSGANPEEDPRLGEVGSFKPQGPGLGETLGERLKKPMISPETTKKIKKFTEVQGKQQFRR